jgi:hypothetical protein
VLDLNNREYGRLGDPNPNLAFPALLANLESAIERFAPDLIGLSVKTFTSQTSKKLIESIRELVPSATYRTQERIVACWVKEISSFPNCAVRSRRIGRFPKSTA